VRTDEVTRFWRRHSRQLLDVEGHRFEFYVSDVVIAELSQGAWAGKAEAVLATWNFRHLANPAKRTHLRVLNGRLGLPVPEVVSPLDLLEIEP
jgi:hypothetical protein